MSERPVKALLGPGERHDGRDGYFYTEPLPNAESAELDPFLLLHHHGPVTLPPRNFGLPFGPHPHRGFETATFIVKGSLTHKDSQGFSSEIHAGGVQWMTAGRGLIHNEFASKKFMREGGDIEMLQLWVNLPNDLRMTPPAYHGLQRDRVTHHTSDKTALHVYSGEVAALQGPLKTLTGISSALIELKAGAETLVPTTAAESVLLYALNGKMTVNGREVSGRQLVVFERRDGDLRLRAESDAVALFCSGKPLNEKYVWQGPFVVADQTRLLEAMRDYQMGKMGFYVD